ncbi:DUF1127 domain-containing protein [Sinirhodobacter huangdaonensis]|uniref:DUF1127 domain-containing protein n=1 Tax=Paenirhodobacter huangdaonensis TaxID=2501515 RepID=A0A3S4MFH5_9RHOB|nr:DUF1127 domain-containing protein [Sinirhodobacter huangdaonensis]RWR50397.1 DUF1127 domain-containing protein [Sinirhodobacter huangdaonensis]
MSSLTLRRSSLLPLKAVALLRLVTHRIETRRTRLALAHLDAHLLRDIGISWEAAQAEAQRPFWRT